MTLRNTQLKTEGAVQVLECMRFQHIRVLDVSFNQGIEDLFYKKLAELLLEASFLLEVLVLEGNNMRDQNCIQVCESLN